MRTATISTVAGAMALALIPVGVKAEPGDSETISGASAAEVIDPGALHRLDDLRFGAFASPAAAATMTIAPDGTVTATGEVATTMNLFVSATGRGPGRFRVQGTDNRMFIAFIPNRVTITSGANSMLVDRMEDNHRPSDRFDANGRFILQIGGRLNVAANQAPGDYRGEFEVTVLFH